MPPRVALTLAGHTHGGQIVLPFLPPLWTPSEYGARFAYGHIVEEGRHMIVSGGLGCSKVPLRLGVPPEIVRVTLGVILNASKRKRRPQAPFSLSPVTSYWNRLPVEASRGLNGESPWCGASTTTTVPGLTRL